MPYSLANTPPPQTATFFDAVGQGDTTTVERMLAADPRLSTEINPEGMTGFMFAASSNQGTIVRILHPESNLEQSDRNGSTALMLAAMNGAMEASWILLEIGCNPNAVTHGGRNALILAARNGHSACVSLLLDCTDPAGYHATHVIGDGLIGAAIRSGDVQTMRLVSRVCDLRQPLSISPKLTPLLFAALSKPTEMVQVIVDEMTPPLTRRELAQALRFLAREERWLEIDGLSTVVDAALIPAFAKLVDAQGAGGLPRATARLEQQALLAVLSKRKGKRTPGPQGGLQPAQQGPLEGGQHGSPEPGVPGQNKRALTSGAPSEASCATAPANAPVKSARRRL